MNSIICGIISAFIVYLYMQKKDKKDKKNNIRKSVLFGLISWFICGKFLSIESRKMFNFSKTGKSCYLDDVKILFDKPDF